MTCFWVVAAPVNAGSAHYAQSHLFFFSLLQVRAREPFTPGMLQDVEQFYFGSYMAHFAEPAFASALAAIPFTFSWDGEMHAAAAGAVRACCCCASGCMLLLRQRLHECVTAHSVSEVADQVAAGVAACQLCVAAAVYAGCCTVHQMRPSRAKCAWYSALSTRQLTSQLLLLLWPHRP
jgi:hypothetical protein